MSKSRLTRGRLRPFSCGHRGFGATCHRCEQGKELATRAEVLSNSVKTKELPPFVEVAADEFVFRAGGMRFCHKCYLGKEKDAKAIAFTEVVKLMRENSERLLAR